MQGSPRFHCLLVLADVTHYLQCEEHSVLALARRHHLSLLSHYVLIFLQSVINCAALIFVHESDVLLHFCLACLQVLLRQFKPDESVTQLGVCVIYLDRELRLFVAVLVE